MENTKQSLIAKIVRKGIITPYEAIYLQYLNRKHMQEQELDVEKWENIYIAAENVSELFSQPDLKNILAFQSLNDATLYDSYRWAANYMTKLDTHTGDIGYRATALLNELRLMRSENAMLITRNLRESKAIEGTLFEFTAYSQTYGKVITFEESIALFTESLSLLLMSIDNILTLNYYLKTMVEQEEFNCLRFLRMILSEERQTTKDEEDPLNVTQLFYKQLVDPIIETNHEKFIEFMKREFSSFSITLDDTFQEGSLLYVRKSLPEITVGIDDAKKEKDVLEQV